MRLLRLVATLFLASLLVAACHRGGGSSNNTQMQAVNAVVGTEPLDVLVNSNVVLSAIPANSASSFASVSSGSQEVTVRSSTNQGTVFDRSLTFSGSNNTLLIFGPRSSVQAMLVPDDPATAPPANDFNFRVVDLSADLGPLDVYLASSADISNASALIPSAVYGTPTTAVQMPAGSYTLVYTIAGTKDVVFTSTPQSLASGASYTALVLPAGGARLSNAMIYLQGTAGSATFLSNPLGRVKAVNAVPASTALTFKADSQTLLSNVPYGGSSNYVNVTSGSHTFQLEASNVPGSTIATLTQTIAPSRDYSLFAMGSLATPSLVAFLDDNTAPASGLVRIRFVNALSDGTPVDALLNFAGQASGLAAGAASGYYSVTPSLTYTVTFTTAGGVTVVATITPVELDAGGVYTAYVTGTVASAQARVSRER